MIQEIKKQHQQEADRLEKVWQKKEQARPKPVGQYISKFSEEPTPKDDFSYLLAKPTIIGICGDVNTGKSMMIYHILETLKKNHKFNLYTYGLRLKFPNAQEIHSVAEMEQITNSILIVDELSSLFDLDNRKVKKQIENSLRLINHNNNILIVCGTPENFKKFISAKVDAMFYKKSALADFINGSRVKNMILNYKGNERGSEMLNLGVGEAICFDGKHYTKIQVPYLKSYDSKSDNESILKST